MTTRHPALSRIASIATATVIAAAALADSLVFSDHFDDATLDPAWQVVFDNANAWSFTETGTELFVTHIDHAATNQWASVSLVRSVPPLGDFVARAEVAWGNPGTEDAVVQRVMFRLADANGSTIAFAWHSDGWLSWSGARGGLVEDGSISDSGLHTEPYSGQHTFTLERTGSVASVSIDNTLIVSGVSTSPATQVIIDFGYSATTDPQGTIVSDFGGLSVDLVEVTVPTDCFADITTSGTSNAVPDGLVDLSDFAFYLSLWSTSDPAADVTPSGACTPGVPDALVDLSDFACYLAEWSAGCP